VKKYGGHAQGALSYTESPVHTVEYYVENFKKLAEMGCDSLVIKDMAGIFRQGGQKRSLRALRQLALIYH